MSIRVGLESVTDVRAMLEGLFEHAPTAFGVVSAAGKTVAVNQAFLDLFGSHPPPEYSIFEDEITKGLGIDSAIRRAFQGETVHLAPFWYDARELKHVKVAGRRVAIEMTLFALRKADGTVEHVALAYKDVTAERELFERERELAATLHSIGDGVIAADTDGRITRMNPVAERLTGWPQEEARGARLSEVFNIINETTRAPVENPAVRVLRDGVVVGLANHTLLVRRDGAEFPIADTGAPIRNAEGGTQGVVLVFRDDTERKEAEAQLLVSDRMASIGTLAAGVAHEINNPLAAVMTNIELAAGEIVEPIAKGSVKPVVEAELKDALEAAERVRLIVRDLKLFGRGDEENRGPVDVRAVLDSTLRIAWNEVKHRARLMRDYGPVPMVEANEARLGQVFLNLIVNATQAIPEGRADSNEISVRTRQDEQGKVIVAVEDTGCGIPEEAVRRIFTPFFTTKPVGVGSGLGLSICHRIITGFGGEISFETKVGVGTRFQIVLPAMPEQPIAPPPPAAPVKTKALRGRVLVVDDDEAVSGALSRLLSRDNEVTVASSGAAALSLLANAAPFDVVLCDLMMPQMTGMDFYEALLARAPEQAARIVFVTGGAFTPRAMEFLAKVQNRRLEKPISSKALRALVQELVSARHLTQ
jgi:PAS domain S-box-containing protein